MAALDVEDKTQQDLSERAVVQLLDGAHRLVLDYEALEQLEEEFVSLELFVERVQESGYASKRLQFIRKALAAALLHEKPEAVTVDVWSLGVRKRLDVSRLAEYLDALVVAIGEAFPKFKVIDEPKQSTEEVKS